MSRLVLRGNLINNFGEYYPTPYIDQVVINDGGFTVVGEDPLGTSLLANTLKYTIDYSFLFLAPEVEPTAPDYDIEPLADAAANLNFYFLMSTSLPEDAPERAVVEHLDGPTVRAYADAIGVDPVPGMPLLDPDIRDALPEGESLAIPGVEDSLDELSLLLYKSSLLTEILKNSDLSPLGIGIKIVEIDRADIYNKIRNREFISLYDEQGRRIVKVTGRTVIAHAAYAQIGSAVSNIDEPNINLMAFASLLNLAELKESPLTTNAAMTTCVGDVAYERLLVENEVPDQTEISYFEANGDMCLETPIQTTNGNYYKPGAITHEQIVTKFKEVIGGYEGLTTTGKRKKKVTDDTLISSIALVRYVLELHGDKVDLLPRINAARKSFVEQSSGTSSGALHNDLTLLMKRVNTSVAQLPPLTKRLTVNSKIIDRRETFFTGFTTPESNGTYEANKITNMADVIKFKLGRSIITTSDRTRRVSYADYDVARGTEWEDSAKPESEYSFKTGEKHKRLQAAARRTETGEVADKIKYEVDLTDPIYDGLAKDSFFAFEEYSISFGYVLVDYRALLVQNSYLAKICDVEKFIKTFGMEYTQTFYVPNKIELTKYKPVYEDNSIADPVPAIEYSMCLGPSSYIDEFGGKTWVYNPTTPEEPAVAERFAAAGWVAGGTSKFPEKVITKGNGTIINQYVAQRNLDFASSEGAADDRIMAFEFQNIDRKGTLQNWDRRVLDTYDFSFQPVDNTKSAMQGVIGQYLLTMSAFKDYLLDAEMICSYNNIDGEFNDFFANAITQRYSGLPAAAPWIHAVVTYIKHFDFLTNRYGGDDIQIILAAKEQIQKVSPQTGTLEHVQAFYQRIVALYEEFYSPSSAIGMAMGGGDSTGDGIPDMFDPAPDTETDYRREKIQRVVEATFIEDDRNEFLSAINAERTRYVEAQDAFEDAKAKARAAAVAAELQRLEDVAAAEQLVKETIEAQTEYEYYKIRRGKGGDEKPNKCLYAVYCASEDTTNASRTDRVADDGLCNTKHYSGPGWYWVYSGATVLDQYVVYKYKDTYNGYQLGRPSTYARRERQSEHHGGEAGGPWFCRSRSRGTWVGDRLPDRELGDWNHHDPYKKSVLKRKIRNRISITIGDVKSEDL